MELRATTDRLLIPAGIRARRIVRLDLTAPVAPPSHRHPELALALVLDRSASMLGDKFELAREATLQAIRSLAPEDRFSVVVYDDQVDVVQPMAPVTPESVTAAEAALAAIGGRGMTDLLGGWLAGCEQVACGLEEGRLGRVLLLSDGQATHGVTRTSRILVHVGEVRSRGVATSTFGIGEDFDQGLMAGMAENGGGNFRYVATAAEIPSCLEDEMGEVLEVTLPGVEVAVDADLREPVRCVNGYPVEHGDDGARLLVGDLASGQVVSAFLDVVVPATAEGETRAASFLVRSGPYVAREQVAWTAVSFAEHHAQPVDRELRRERARMEARRGERAALEVRQKSGWAEAVDEVRRTQDEIRREALGDPEVLRIADELESVEQLMAAPQVLRLLVKRHAEAAYALKGRQSGGAATRTPGESREPAVPVNAR